MPSAPANCVSLIDVTQSLSTEQNLTASIRKIEVIQQRWALHHVWSAACTCHCTGSALWAHHLL